MPYLAPLSDGTVLVRLHVQPKASKTRIAGMYDGCLKLAVLAPPVDGKANEEVVRFLSEVLGLPGRDIILKSGAQGRRKQLILKGLTIEEVRRRVALRLGNTT